MYSQLLGLIAREHAEEIEPRLSSEVYVHIATKPIRNIGHGREGIA